MKNDSRGPEALGFQDQKGQKCTNKAENIALKSKSPSQIEISDDI